MGHAHAALRPIGPCVLSVQMSVLIIQLLPPACAPSTAYYKGIWDAAVDVPFIARGVIQAQLLTLCGIFFTVSEASVSVTLPSLGLR